MTRKIIPGIRIFSRFRLKIQKVKRLVTRKTIAEKGEKINRKISRKTTEITGMNFLGLNEIANMKTASEIKSSLSVKLILFLRL